MNKNKIAIISIIIILLLLIIIGLTNNPIKCSLRVCEPALVG